MIACPNDNVTVITNVLDGFTVNITLQSNQKWVAQKGRRYYHLSRKGVCCKLRLTERIFNELFRIIPEDPGKGVEPDVV